MKNVYRLGLPGILLTSLALPVCADDVDPYGDQIITNTGQISSRTQQTVDNTKQIGTYLLNFGAYLGFDLSQSPKSPVAPLLSLTNSQLFGGAGTGSSGGSGTGSNAMPLFSVIYDTFLGALPVNAAASQLVPDNNPSASTINAFANSTFPSYNNASSGQGNTVSAYPGVDQLTYQQDPVSQAVLNILSTPDYSYCMDSSGSSWTGGAILTGATSAGGGQTYPNCKYLYGNKVMSNIIGDLPTPYSFFTYDYNQQFLGQLNINTLVSPLLYSTTSSNTPSTSSPTPSSQQQNNGLPAQNQAQLASDFIRYASGAVAPISLPQQNVYSLLYAQATNSSNNVPLTQQIASQAVLNNYFAKLRAYAAVISVPYSNLYYIFSKRMPQNTSAVASSASATSQALNEFTMSTWRLYTPQGQANAQWLNQLNTASSATVQKEIATLLAEINYQLYLTRQQEERILLTNTMLLLLGSHSTQPLAPTLDSLNTSSTSQPNNQ